MQYITYHSSHVIFSLEDNDVDDVVSKFDAIIAKYLEVEDLVLEHKSVLSLYEFVKMDPSMIKFNQIVEVDLLIKYLILFDGCNLFISACHGGLLCYFK